MGFDRQMRRGGAAFAVSLAGAVLVTASAPAAPDVARKRSTKSVRAVLGDGFEHWTASNARLTRIVGGLKGGDALVVTAGRRTDGYSVYRTTPAVPAAVKGAAYTATAWIRSDQPGKQVCLRVRERNASGAVVGSAQTCAATTAAWQRLPAVGHSAVGEGPIDHYVYQAPSARGDSFVVGGLTLAASSPPPAPAPAPHRFFADDSPLNTRIPANPEIDPDSALMVQQFVDETNARGWGIAADEWTATIWYADASTPRHEVPLRVNPFGGTKIVDVPIPTHAVPGKEADGEMVVVDRSTGCVYDFGQAVKNADGSWRANFVNALWERGSGIFPWANSNSGSGFSYLAGKILPEELQAGRIDHALTFAMHHTKRGGPVLPATGSDGWSTLAGAIPEGARLQLDPALDLDSLGLAPWQKTIARALQEYGMYLFDTGGAPALYAQSRDSTTTPYPWGDVSYAYLPARLARHLRVLRTGPQYDPLQGWDFMRHPCAQYR